MIDLRFPKRPIEHRLRHLGKHLGDLGTCPLSEFKEFITCSLWDRASRTLVGMEATLEQQKGAPDSWASEMRRQMDDIRTAMLEPEYLIPQELSQSGSIEVAARDCQKIVEQFGHVIHYWPDIVETTGRLTSRGILMAREI